MLILSSAWIFKRYSCYAGFLNNLLTFISNWSNGHLFQLDRRVYTLGSINYACSSQQWWSICKVIYHFEEHIRQILFLISKFIQSNNDHIQVHLKTKRRIEYIFITKPKYTDFLVNKIMVTPACIYNNPKPIASMIFNLTYM